MTGLGDYTLDQYRATRVAIESAEPFTDIEAARISAAAASLGYEAPRKQKPRDQPDDRALTMTGATDIAEVMGKDGGEPVYSAGPVRVGIETFILGVCPAPLRRWWYIYRNGLLFRFKDGKGKRPRVVVDPTVLSGGAVTLWADALAREFIDSMTRGRVEHTVGPMYARYSKLVRAFVEGAIVDMAALDIERDVDFYAKACNRGWQARDLLSGNGTVLHATLVSLVLALSEDEAAQLIEYAAFLEWRIPLLQRETAHYIHVEARRLLGIMLPAWWAQGRAFDWTLHGTSVSDIWGKQFMRMANDADDRGIPLELLAATRKGLTQLGMTPMTARYLRRTEEATAADLAELAKVDEVPDFSIPNPMFRPRYVDWGEE